MKTYACEYTGTFGWGNKYSWIRRAEFQAPENASRSLIMRRAKAALGLSGLRMRVTTDAGGRMGIEARPYRMHTVLFVYPSFEPVLPEI